MQKILVISDSPTNTRQIQNMIQTQLPYLVYSAADQAQITAQIESKVFNLVIIDVAMLDENIFKVMESFSRAANSFPQIFIAGQVSPNIHAQLLRRGDAHFLTRPLTEKAILGLVRKLLVSKKVPKQIHQRFNTNQIAQIEALSSGNNLLTSMYNLSKGGAYCEFDSNNVLSVGDVIRFRVALENNNKEYALSAKVVWTTPRGRFSGRFGCGFKFVNGSDIYGSMRF